MSIGKESPEEIVQELQQLVVRHRTLYESLPFLLDDIRPRNFELLLQQCKYNNNSLYMSDSYFQFMVSEHLDTRCQQSDLNVEQLKVQFHQLQQNIEQYQMQYDELKDKIDKKREKLAEQLPNQVRDANAALSKLCLNLKFECDVPNVRDATPTNQECQVISSLVENSMQASRVSQKRKHKENVDNLDFDADNLQHASEPDINESVHGLDDKVELDAQAIPQ